MESYVKLTTQEYLRLVRTASQKEAEWEILLEGWSKQWREDDKLYKEKYLAIKDMNYFQFRKLRKLLKG